MEAAETTSLGGGDRALLLPCEGGRPLQNVELLQRTLSALLQQSLVQSNEELTDLVYRACFFHNKRKGSLASNHESNPITASQEPGGVYERNFLGEVREVLNCLVEHHERLSLDVLFAEICRADKLLREARAFLRRWKHVPSITPVMEESAACVAHALAAMDDAHLALCEDSLYNFTQSIHAGRLAVHRGCGYLDLLLRWIQGGEHCSGDRRKSCKRRRASSSGHNSTDTALVAQYEKSVAESGSRLPLPPLPPCLPEPSEVSNPRQPSLPEEACQAGQAQLFEETVPLQAKRNATETEHTPNAVLRAQQLLEGLLPFLEQQVAAVVAEARSHLLQWTSGVSPNSVISVDDT
ncbi:YCF1 [Symbiodinium sp. CCMP2592]|nr:YCF1 [Symbiodinium sp. CCMP2592]